MCPVTSHASGRSNPAHLYVGLHSSGGQVAPLWIELAVAQSVRLVRFCMRSVICEHIPKGSAVCLPITPGPARGSTVGDQPQQLLRVHLWTGFSRYTGLASPSELLCPRSCASKVTVWDFRHRGNPVSSSARHVESSGPMLTQSGYNLGRLC